MKTTINKIEKLQYRLRYSIFRRATSGQSNGTSVTFHAPVVNVLCEFVDDGQITVAVTDMAQLADEVVSDFVDRSNEAVRLRMAHQFLAELRSVLGPLAALPTTAHRAAIRQQRHPRQCNRFRTERLIASNNTIRSF